MNAWTHLGNIWPILNMPICSLLAYGSSFTTLLMRKTTITPVRASKIEKILATYVHALRGGVWVRSSSKF